jgi:hypothetical protein
MNKKLKRQEKTSLSDFYTKKDVDKLEGKIR